MSSSRDMPTHRRLRVFAVDPSLDRAQSTVEVSRLCLRVPWTDASEPGPVGEYVEVVDVDPASGCWYEPVDLNAPALLAEDGLEPTTADPKFHQQMVYAVAMTTIGDFERALGRRIQWAERRYKDAGGQYHDDYVPRLRIYPHAFRGQNAYYSPTKKALLFGYFPATAQHGFQPGGIVFTCLSHDVIVHECCHAVLDGMHRRYLDPSNPDVLAFHEAFADLVALFQRFSWPELLRGQIDRTGGDLRRQSLLGQLAQEFGRATGRYGALRDALGNVDPATQEWRPRAADPTAIKTASEPHERGSLLVAAVFDAYLTIYMARVADLLRLAAQLRGGNFQGPLPTELRDRLADEAAKAARHVLTMCIRALDYCPPFDITFGDYLRALITADYDVVRNDRRGYRAAFVEAFERWGIYPAGVRSMSVEDLLWRPPALEQIANLWRTDGRLSAAIRDFADEWTTRGDREAIYHGGNNCCAALHGGLTARYDELTCDLGRALGLDLTAEKDSNGKHLTKYEVHSIRPARRIGPDGQTVVDVVVEITQRRGEWVRTEEAGHGEPDFYFRGGSTLIVSPETGNVRYCITKSILSQSRLEQHRQMVRKLGQPGALESGFGVRQHDPLEARPSGQLPSAEPLALLHSSEQGGEWQ